MSLCLSLFVDGCLGTKYNNFGCYGAGLSNIEADFEGYESLRHKLLVCPKMGNEDDGVDGIACALMQVIV